MRWVWAGLLAAVVSLAVSFAAVQFLRTPTIAGRGPQPATGVPEGSVNAARHAQGAVVVVESTLADGSVVRASGAVIDGKGIIITAERAIAGASRVSVAVPGKKLADAQVVGSDPVSGISLLRIAVADLHALQTASGGALEAGTGIVVAPATGLAVGAVSAAGVSAELEDPARPGQKVWLNDLLTLDISAHEGQLGAPIVDGAGRMVGLVIAAGTTLFGVDMADATSAIQQLTTAGHTSYPSLGFAYRQLSVSEAADRGLPQGAEVVSVADGSPAAAAGLTAGDLVYSVNGTVLTGALTLRHVLAGVPVSQQVTLDLRSAVGAERKVQLALELVTP